MDGPKIPGSSGRVPEWFLCGLLQRTWTLVEGSPFLSSSGHRNSVISGPWADAL